MAYGAAHTSKEVPTAGAVEVPDRSKKKRKTLSLSLSANGKNPRDSEIPPTQIRRRSFFFFLLLLFLLGFCLIVRISDEGDQAAGAAYRLDRDAGDLRSWSLQRRPAGGRDRKRLLWCREPKHRIGPSSRSRWQAIVICELFSIFYSFPFRVLSYIRVSLRVCVLCFTYWMASLKVQCNPLVCLLTVGWFDVFIYFFGENIDL